MNSLPQKRQSVFLKFSNWPFEWYNNFAWISVLDAIFQVSISLLTSYGHFSRVKCTHLGIFRRNLVRGESFGDNWQIDQILWMGLGLTNHMLFDSMMHFDVRSLFSSWMFVTGLDVCGYAGLNNESGGRERLLFSFLCYKGPSHVHHNFTICSVLAGKIL